MIARVITVVGRCGLSPAHNAPASPVTQFRRRDGIFTVITPFRHWQQTLSITKYHSVFFVFKRPTLMDQPKNCGTWVGQFGYRYRCSKIGCHSSSGLHQTCTNQHPENKASER